MLRPLLLLLLAGIAGGCFSQHEPDLSADTFTCERAEQSAGPDSAIVIIRGFSFEPATAEVTEGTRVVWINCEPDGAPNHTSTSQEGIWDSPALSIGEAFSTDAPTSGTHEYFCRLHPFMRGRVAVVTAQAQREMRLARR